MEARRGCVFASISWQARLEGSGHEPCTYAGGSPAWQDSFGGQVKYIRQAKHIRRLMLVVSSLLILLGLITTVYVSYRHYLFFKRLPTMRFTPERLTLPLKSDELSVAQMRWVEVEATVAPSSSLSPNKYQEALESEGTLVLQFGDD